MRYVYILQSVGDHEHHYVGMSEDIFERLAAHNAGRVSHTAKFRPWRMKTYVCFSDEAQAPLILGRRGKFDAPVQRRPIIARAVVGAPRDAVVRDLIASDVGIALGRMGVMGAAVQHGRD